MSDAKDLSRGTGIFFVGVYGESGITAEKLRRCLPEKEVLEFRSERVGSTVRKILLWFEKIVVGLDGITEEIMRHAIAKEEFFRVCTHVIVEVTGLASMAFVGAGMNALAKSEIETLTIVGRFSEEVLFSLATGREVIDKLLDEGRLHIIEEFSFESWKQKIGTD